MLCPCRKALRLRLRDQDDRKETPLLGSNLKAVVDYSSIFPTFTSILSRRFNHEREALLRLQGLLNQWAYCEAGLCNSPESMGWLENGLMPWSGPGLALHSWSPSIRAKAADIYFKACWPPTCPWFLPNMHACEAKQGTKVRKMLDNVKNTLSNLVGWTETSAPLWNLLWRFCDPTPEPSATLLWQVMCRHPNAGLLGTKDSLMKVLGKCWNCAGVDDGPFDIAPKTFELPQEIGAFNQAFGNRAASGKSNTWILKPSAGSLGRGIELLTDPQQAEGVKETIVQYYLDRPLLVQGYKFDMRVYVIVTSFVPLEAFVSTIGLARFTKEKYTPDLSNMFAHLTNTAVQKFCDKPGLLNGATGCEFAKLRSLLEEQGVNWATIWQNVKNLILEALVCTEGDLGHMPQTFQMLGFDVMFDEDLRAWLIEVNRRPSLAITNDLDLYLKPTVVSNIAELVSPVPFDRYALAQVVERRLQEVGQSVDPATEQHQLNKDLYAILGGRLPRQYGDPQPNAEKFHRIAPSEDYTRLQIMRKTCPRQSS